MLLTDDKEADYKVRKWSTQSRENAPWYQHEELGYNYRMSNVIAGVVRGQISYLDEHINQKKAMESGKLTDIQVEMLKTLPLEQVGRKDKRWCLMYEDAKKYYLEFDDLNVPTDYLNSDEKN